MKQIDIIDRELYFPGNLTLVVNGDNNAEKVRFRTQVHPELEGFSFYLRYRNEDDEGGEVPLTRSEDSRYMYLDWIPDSNFSSVAGNTSIMILGVKPLPPAPAYSTTATYSVGDRVVYTGVHYICKASTSGAWDSTKWSAEYPDTWNSLPIDITVEPAIGYESPINPSTPTLILSYISTVQGMKGDIDNIKGEIDTIEEDLEGIASAVETAQAAIREAQEEAEEAVNGDEDSAKTRAIAAVQQKGVEVIASIPADFQTQISAEATARSNADSSLRADIVEQQYAIDNLKAMTEGKTHNTYTETTSNGTKTLTSSANVAPYAEVNSVLGKSLVWNHLLDGTYTNNNVVYDSTNRTYRLAYSSQYQSVQFPSTDLSLVNGHKYFQSLDLQVVSNDGQSLYIRGRSGDYNYGNITTTTSIAYNQIIPADANASTFRVRVDTMSSSSGEFVVKNIMLVDLTQMFGAGNEPSSTSDARIAWIKAYLAEHPSYETGKILSLKGAITVRSKGRNILNPSCLSYGKAYDTSGNEYSSSNVIAVKVKVNPSTNYVLSSVDFGTRLRMDSDGWFEWDSSGNFIGRKDVRGYNSTDDKTLTTLANTGYVGFMVRGMSITISSLSDINDSQLQFEKGQTSTDYAPYMTPSSITLKDSITLRSAGTARDEYSPETGKIQRNAKDIVFDGSDDENWDMYSPEDRNVFHMSINGMKWVLKDFVCNRFTPVYSSWSSDSSMAYCMGSNGTNVYFNMTGTEVNSISAWKTWLASNNVKLIYPLAETSEETEEACNRFLKVEKGGTISVTSNESYGDAEITYQTQIS